MNTIIRILRLILNGWSVRFSYFKKFPAKNGNTVSTLCDTIESAEETDRRLAPATTMTGTED